MVTCLPELSQPSRLPLGAAAGAGARAIVVGAGMAGCEAAWFLANQGIHVHLFESKKLRKTEAQKTSYFAELVCTNSLKSLDPTSAHGLLKEEMRALGSLILKKATEHAVPAGQALAVDREAFAEAVTVALQSHPLITVHEQIVADPLALLSKYDAQYVIVATGPLAQPELTEWMQREITGSDDLYFYDAIAPVVDGDSLDYDKLYYKDRHRDPALSADYLNAPFHDKQDYERFIDALLAAPLVELKSFEKPIYFESCLPIDEMARRGRSTPRFSCMKPVGLEQAGVERLPYAVVQLRKENQGGTAFNMVGFQTRLTYGAQLEVFRLIPGLEQAQFLKLGSIHRNTFLNAAKILNSDMSTKKHPKLFFAGQITGVEGYTESAASGLYAAWQVWNGLQGKSHLSFPTNSAIGSLVQAVAVQERPVPTNINFGLFPAPEVPVELLKRQGKDRKAYRKEVIISEARSAFQKWWEPQARTHASHFSELPTQIGI